jgi:hypothetical protein
MDGLISGDFQSAGVIVTDFALHYQNVTQNAPNSGPFFAHNNEGHIQARPLLVPNRNRSCHSNSPACIGPSAQPVKANCKHEPIKMKLNEKTGHGFDDYPTRNLLSGLIDDWDRTCPETKAGTWWTNLSPDEKRAEWLMCRRAAEMAALGFVLNAAPAVVFIDDFKEAAVIVVQLAPPPSDLTMIVRHAADALECYADCACWHRDRAVARGLQPSLATRAMDGAAKRADELAGFLRGLTLGQEHQFTAGDWSSWLEADFKKVYRSRRTVIKAAERDFLASGRDLNGPELQQLREIEALDAMCASLDAAMFIADAMMRTLSGQYDPTKARVIAAEEMSCLYANLREWRL